MIVYRIDKGLFVKDEEAARESWKKKAEEDKVLGGHQPKIFHSDTWNCNAENRQ